MAERRVRGENIGTLVNYAAKDFNKDKKKLQRMLTKERELRKRENLNMVYSYYNEKGCCLTCDKDKERHRTIEGKCLCYDCKCRNCEMYHSERITLEIGVGGFCEIARDRKRKIRFKGLTEKSETEKSLSIEA